ncbi:PCC domain-containing protein [Leptothrix sp. BB-4]
MRAPRQIVHPGPSRREASVLPVRLATHDLRLGTGTSFLDAVDTAVRAACGGPASGVLHLKGGRCEPWPYVLPALSRTPEHAVYFSERHEAVGAVELVEATVTLGLRADGRPWLHSHVDWIEADGTRGCGHVLPEQARLADAPLQATFWQMRDADYTVQADEETRFSLFKPASKSTPSPDAIGHAGRPALAVRLAPNQDVCEAIESICAAHGIGRAVVRGGVGSTVGAVFDDGRVVEPFVTETLIRHGTVEPDEHGRPRAALDITMIDFHGGRHQGRLARGENPVLVTFELVLDVLDVRD